MTKTKQQKLQDAQPLYRRSWLLSEKREARAVNAGK